MSSSVTAPDAVVGSAWAKDGTPEGRPNARQEADRTSAAGSAATTLRPTSLASLPVEHESPEKRKPGKMEYAVMLTLALISLMVALDATILVSVLPTLAQDLGGSSTDAFWAGTSYLLSCAVCQPFIAALSDIFGRREMLISSLLFFTLGTLLCAPVAKNFTVFFVGRSIQGIGGGGIITLGQVIYSDIIPLRQRPKYFSFVLAAWALGSVLGPLIGGLPSPSTWAAFRPLTRRQFPFCALGLLLVPIYVRLSTVKTSLASKLRRIDWVGGIFFIGGLTSFLIGISWGGIQYEWSSGEAITPIVAGVLSIIVALVWEVYGSACEPFLRPSLFTSLSALATYVAALFQGFILFCALYYIPFYFTAVRSAGPTQSGLDIFPVTCFLLPGSIVISLLTTRFGRYRWAIWSGWPVTAVACGLLVMFDADVKTPVWAVILAVFGIGHGMLLTSINVGIQAVSRVEDSGRAAAMYAFMRTLGMSVGVAVGGTVFQNVMRSKLKELGLSEEIARDSEAYVRRMVLLAPDDPERLAAVEAYLAGFHGVFWTITGAAIAAMLVCLAIRHSTMDKAIDTRFVLEGGRGDHGPGGPSAGASAARGVPSGPGNGAAVELGHLADLERQSPERQQRPQQRQKQQQERTQPFPCLPPIEVQHGRLDLDWDENLFAVDAFAPAPVTPQARLPPRPPSPAPAPSTLRSPAAMLPTGPFGPKCDTCKGRSDAPICCGTQPGNRSRPPLSNGLLEPLLRRLELETGLVARLGSWASKLHPLLELVLWRGEQQQQQQQRDQEEGRCKGKEPVRPLLRPGHPEQPQSSAPTAGLPPQEDQEGVLPTPKRRDTWLTSVDTDAQPAGSGVVADRAAASHLLVIPPAIRDLVTPPRPAEDGDAQGGSPSTTPPVVWGSLSRLNLRGGFVVGDHVSDGSDAEDEEALGEKRGRVRGKFLVGPGESVEEAGGAGALLRESPGQEAKRLEEQTGPLKRVRGHSDLQALLRESGREGSEPSDKRSQAPGPLEQPAPPLRRTRRCSNLQALLKISLLQDDGQHQADGTDGGGKAGGDPEDKAHWFLFSLIPPWPDWRAWLRMVPRVG
ncbi:hypothetical protein VTJ83DRAFT_6062 [Remersonia thermophila]|uniref:Major facilitator superfamily (MFS) profile domain-containing protein n=1 Tax=Remersonia thermophila TaxID=72144 RepID=A0ABR4D8M0_9PEZI